LPFCRDSRPVGIGRSIGLHQITISSRKAEVFYWATDHVLADAGPGARRLDGSPNSGFAVGYDGGALVFAAASPSSRLLNFWTRVSRTLLFWIAFILTRPLGATLGDLLDSAGERGLALSRFGPRRSWRFVIIACIFFLPQKAERTVSAGISHAIDYTPKAGTRYWSVLCLASIFGANMGDFFARVLWPRPYPGRAILASRWWRCFSSSGVPSP